MSSRELAAQDIKDHVNDWKEDRIDREGLIEEVKDITRKAEARERDQHGDVR